MDEADATAALKALPPFARMSWQRLMLWAFLVTDALLFASLLAGYGYVRMASPQWPHPAHIFNLKVVVIMTVVLVSSSGSMAAAIRASQRLSRPLALRSLLLTSLGGLAFLAMQAYEWTGLIREGTRLYANPWGVPPFSAFFFVLTGFHGAHVLTGVTILALIAFRLATGRISGQALELAGLYWYFVDLVWVFIFAFFYLI